MSLSHVISYGRASPGASRDMRFSNFSHSPRGLAGHSWSYQSDFKWFGPLTSTCYNIDDPEILQASIRAWACVLGEVSLKLPRRFIHGGSAHLDERVFAVVDRFEALFLFHCLNRATAD